MTEKRCNCTAKQNDFIKAEIIETQLVVTEVTSKIQHIVDSPLKELEAPIKCDDQMKLLVDSSEQINNRRQGMNNFFWAINAALVTGYFGLFSIMLKQGDKLHVFIVLAAFAVLSIIGQLFCDRWAATIRNYAAISRSKIALIQALERKTEYRIFSCQYDLLPHFGYKSQTVLEAGQAELCINIHRVICGVSVLACTLLTPYLP